VGVENEELYWKDAATLTDAQELIEHCILVKWSNMASLQRTFDSAAQKKIMAYFGKRLATAEKNRLIEVVTVESALVWLASAESEDLEEAFLERLLVSESLVQEFISTVQSMEFIDQEHGEKIYASAVVIICKLGLHLWERKRSNPGKSQSIDPLLQTIASHLLSVSNRESTAIRLSLMQYFGYMSQRDASYYISFERITTRFGFTLMEQLFALLENTRCNTIALHYLLEIGTYILGARAPSQQILHHTFRSFMLKEPERFLVVMEAFAAHLNKEGELTRKQRSVFLQHLGMLVNIIAETSHKLLTNNLLYLMATYYQEETYQALLTQLMASPSIKAKVKLYLKDLNAIKSDAQLARIESVLRLKKRGRKPLQNSPELRSPLSQVSFLGKFELPQAS
jgi:hypothetical protein